MLGAVAASICLEEGWAACLKFALGVLYQPAGKQAHKKPLMEAAPGEPGAKRRRPANAGSGLPQPTGGGAPAPNELSRRERAAAKSNQEENSHIKGMLNELVFANPRLGKLSFYVISDHGPSIVDRCVGGHFHLAGLGRVDL